MGNDKVYIGGEHRKTPHCGLLSLASTSVNNNAVCRHPFSSGNSAGASLGKRVSYSP